MRPSPKFLKNKAIDLDDFDDYGETIQFPKLYNISRDLWEDVVEEEEEEEENTRGKRARARAPDMRNIAKALDEAIDILDPEDILTRRPIQIN